MHDAYSSGQRMRFLSITLFIIVAASTEMEHLGDIPSYRLVLNLVGSVLTSYGAFQFMREVRVYRRAQQKAKDLL